jgi:hypothetical protein
MTQGKPHTLAPEDCFLPVNGIAPQSEDRLPLRIDRCFKSTLLRIDAKSIRQSTELLSLFDVQCYSSKTRAVLLQLKLFSPWSSQHHVVDIPGFLTNEECGFLFLFALRHDRSNR